jgi:hydrophobic/amphiphilic exporter-1 (mainly G- bacteria), HAE1 family
MNLSDLAMKRPVTVCMITLALLALGAVSITRLKSEFLPKLDFPFIGVWAPYPNAVPAQVEKEIARPVEEIMATLGDVNEIWSDSDENGAFIGVVFDFGRNVDVLRMEVQEKLEQVKPLLPDDLRDTYLFTFNSSDIPIMVGRISAHGRDLSGHYDLLEQRVLNPMRRIEGVGRVEVDGIAPKSIRIYLLLDKIVEHSIDVGRLFDLLNRNNIDLSVGRVNEGRQRITVRTLGQFRDMSDIEELVVSESGLRLKDIAEIDYGEPAPRYYRHLNGEMAIAFEVQKASGANVIEVSEQIHQVLEDINHDPVLDGIDVVLFFDQAEQIQGSLNSVLQAGVIGSLLAVGVLFLFLRRLKTTLIISVAIPFCVISACTFLYLTGRSLNMLSMMGLMLAVGMLVDNAIVVLESIYRRQQDGLSPMEASRAGSREVMMAVIAATLTSIIVFAPIVLSKDNEIGIWLAEVGITISVTLVFSLLVCLTLVPILAARTSAGKPVPEFRFLVKMREIYLRMLRWTAIKHPKRTGLIFVPIFLVVTVIAMQAFKFGQEEMDGRGVRQEHVYFWIDFTDNVNIYGVDEYVDTIESFLLAETDSMDVEYVYVYYQDNYAGFQLHFPKGKSIGEKEVKEMRTYLRENLPEIAGGKYRFGDENDVGVGAKRLNITLFGEDTELLETLATEAGRQLKLVDDLQDVTTDTERGGDEVRIVLDKSLGSRYNISSQTLAEILGLTFRGVPLREFQSRDREIDMDIVLEPSNRRNIDNLARLPVTYRDDRPILLGQIADFEIGKGAKRIHREHQKTAMAVHAMYEGENYGDLVDKVERIMNNLDLPTGYSWSFGRELLRSQQEQNDMAINVVLALICVYLLMAALFESFLHPLVIMLCIPFAGLGVVWTLMLTGTPMNIMAMIGMVILIGVVVNNGIVLLDHVNNLRRKGYDRTTAIMDGCQERFRPILMTAATTILGLAPLAFGKAALGGGYYFPLARAIMGGLAMSTMLTLIVLPTFYILAEGAVAKSRKTISWGMGKSAIPWRATQKRTDAVS